MQYAAQLSWALPKTQDRLCPIQRRSGNGARKVRNETGKIRNEIGKIRNETGKIRIKNERVCYPLFSLFIGDGHMRLLDFSIRGSGDSR